MGEPNLHLSFRCAILRVAAEFRGEWFDAEGVLVEAMTARLRQLGWSAKLSESAEEPGTLVVDWETVRRV